MIVTSLLLSVTLLLITITLITHYTDYTIYCKLMCTFLPSVSKAMFDANNFAENATFSEKHATRFLNRFKTYFRWKESENILDIGCANGKLTKNVLYPFVESHLGHLFGADYDDRAIDTANKNHATEKISFFQLNAEDDQQATENQDKFDHIFAFYLLHWVSLEKWPNNFYKMVKKGGQLYAHLWLAPNALTQTVHELKKEKEKPWSQHLEEYHFKYQDFGSSPIETITCHLNNAGFTVDMIDILECETVFRTSDILLKIMISGLGLEQLMPVEMYMDFSKDFFEQLVAQTDVGTHEEGYLFKTRVLLFIASKS